MANGQNNLPIQFSVPNRTTRSHDFGPAGSQVSRASFKSQLSIDNDHSLLRVDPAYLPRYKVRLDVWTVS